MRVPCGTRLFLNSWHPGLFGHSNVNFYCLWIWLFSGILASPSQWWFFNLHKHHPAWAEWGAAHSCNTLTHVSFSPGWNRITCSCNWETKDWVPKYCSLWLHYHLLRVQGFPGSVKLPVSHIWAIASSEDGKHEGPFAGLSPLFQKKCRYRLNDTN